MLETGVVLLFLLPGLAAYAALYALFHDGKAIAPEPPGANTVEAVAIIGGMSVAVHALTASLFAVNRLLCDGGCPLSPPLGWVDPYRSGLSAIGGGGMAGSGIALSLIGVCAQGIVTYVAIRLWLRRRARRDGLPTWIYGWATSLANALDNDETAVIAYVMTTTEVNGRTLTYGGLVHDIALKPDGCLTRITLTDCERYLIDLETDADPSLSGALSRFSFLLLDATQIRNVAFELIDLAAVAER